MSTWTIYLEESNGSWTLDTAIPRPNEDMETTITSTQQRVQLANGAIGFFRPETRYNKESIKISWLNTTTDFRSQITGYITNGDKVKIVTHSGEEFTGRFISMSRVWFVGMTDTYDIQTVFEQVS